MRRRLGEAWHRLRGTLRGDRVTEEVDEEFRFHLDQATARNIARGMTPEAARREAQRSFGGTARHRDAGGDEQRSRWIEGIAHDIRLAARTLGRNPGFSLATLLLVALGIGANSAVFSVINGVMLRPLPFPDPGRVLYLGWDYGNTRMIEALSLFQMEFLNEHSTALEGAATWRTFEAALGDVDADVSVSGLRVSAGFFRVTGLAPMLGRAFGADEYAPGGADVVIATHGYWRDRQGADSAALGTRVRLDGRPYTLVGVMAPGFRLPEESTQPGLLLPLRTQPDQQDGGQNYTVLARRQAGTTRAALAADLAALSTRFTAAYPDHGSPPRRGDAGPSRARFLPLSWETVFVGDLERLLWVLFAAVGFVTLIVCVNAANLLLAHATARSREIAVRAALGAGRGRIVRQLMIESLLLSTCAGALGLVLGLWGVDGLLALAPRELPRVEEIGLDWRVALFTFGVALGTGLVTGLTSALTATRSNLAGLATGAGRGGTPDGGRMREALVVLETGIAAVLLAASGLLIASFARLRDIDPGFDSEGVLTVTMTRMTRDYREEGRIWEFERRALQELRAIPGVEGAAVLSNFPLERGLNLPMTIAGRPDQSEGAVEWRGISDGYFETLRVPLRAGRGFTAQDHAGAPRVGVVNAAFAERYWPGQNPIGKRIELGRWQGEWVGPGFAGAVEVVGVAGDLREISLAGAPRRTLYVPRSQWSGLLNWSRFAVRVAQVRGVDALVADAIHRADPRLPPPRAGSLPDIVQASLAAQRFQALLLGVFAASALLLTAIGIYGVMAFTVTQRTREIGIRMALGARRGRVLGMVVRRAGLLVAAGLIIGLPATIAATRLLKSMLFEVSPTDPRTLATAATVLAVVGLAAALLPARRATRVDPMEALRTD